MTRTRPSRRDIRFMGSTSARNTCSLDIVITFLVHEQASRVWSTRPSRNIHRSGDRCRLADTAEVRRPTHHAVLAKSFLVVFDDLNSNPGPEPNCCDLCEALCQRSPVHADGSRLFKRLHCLADLSLARLVIALKKLTQGNG